MLCWKRIPQTVDCSPSLCWPNLSVFSSQNRRPGLTWSKTPSHTIARTTPVCHTLLAKTTSTPTPINPARSSRLHLKIFKTNILSSPVSYAHLAPTISSGRSALPDTPKVICTLVSMKVPLIASIAVTFTHPTSDASTAPTR